MQNQTQMIKGQMWVYFEGKTFIYEGPQSSSGAKKKASVAGGDIISPMPGKITKIQKTLGDAVSSGDVVIVMEAMKMEYTLKAHVAGTIEKLNCKVGDQVTLGKLLAQIKEGK